QQQEFGVCRIGVVRMGTVIDGAGMALGGEQHLEADGVHRLPVLGCRHRSQFVSQDCPPQMKRAAPWGAAPMAGLWRDQLATASVAPCAAAPRSSSRRL